VPAGIEIMIAKERPRAKITRAALIFLLDRFLAARVNEPIHVTFENRSLKKVEDDLGIRCLTVLD
jgi:hypothetical protein